MKHSRMHLIFLIFWVICIIPTLMWWRESILWVAFMSLYANIASHWGAFEASKAKEDIEEKIKASLIYVFH